MRASRSISEFEDESGVRESQMRDGLRQRVPGLCETGAHGS
jgi:hypothetical protein